MSTVINTNMASLLAQNSLSGAQNALAGSVQRLSSGLRINAAKDDAAGLAISQNMQSQINGINQSIRNLTDATNLIQTADSSLGTVQDMLLRMKTLAVQGFNGSLSSQQRSNLVDELRQLNDEINNTAIRTRFNGNNLIVSDVAESPSANTLSLTSATFTVRYDINSTQHNVEFEGLYTLDSVNNSTITITDRFGNKDTATLTQTNPGGAATSQTISALFSDFGLTITATIANTTSSVANFITGLDDDTLT